LSGPAVRALLRQRVPWRALPPGTRRTLRGAAIQIGRRRNAAAGDGQHKGQPVAAGQCREITPVTQGPAAPPPIRATCERAEDGAEVRPVEISAAIGPITATAA